MIIEFDCKKVCWREPSAATTVENLVGFRREIYDENNTTEVSVVKKQFERSLRIYLIRTLLKVKSEPE